MVSLMFFQDFERCHRTKGVSHENLKPFSKIKKPLFVSFEFPPRVYQVIVINNILDDLAITHVVFDDARRRIRLIGDNFQRNH